MTPLASRALAALAAATLALSALPAVADAQKALVYCPVGIDVAGCDRAVAALAPDFPDGVDRGYDGSGGSVDVKTADLWSYSVLVVPSLADGGDRAPYALLRDAAVAERLHDALMGRVALWSGTPDQGTTNREAKDALIRSIAHWAAGNYGTVKGPGLVAFQDLSDVVAQRYGWLKGLTGLTVTADSAVISYASVRAMTATGAAILANGSGSTIAYTNMASLGFYLPQGAANVTLDAVGQTGTTQGGQVVLVTSPGGNTGGAVVRTDKDDYAPGTTVTITGTGFQAGETVTMVLHEDPVVHENRTLTSVADGSGGFVNTSFAPEDHDVGVRFILTATGATSGVRAEATFTDGMPGNVQLSPASVTVAPGGSATYDVNVTMTGNSNACTVTLAVTTALPTGATATFSGTNPITLPDGSDDIQRTLTISTTISGPPAGRTPAGTYPFTVQALRGSNCQGSGTGPTISGTLIVETPVVVNTAPVLGAIANQTISEGATLSASASATDDGLPSSTLTYSLTTAPSGATINSTSGAISWLTGEADGPGSYNFTVQVSDGALTDSKSFTVTVSEVNQAPVWTTIGNKSVSEGSPLSFTVGASDGDLPANTLTYSVVGSLPTGATFNASTRTFSWTPGEADGGTAPTVTLRVSDGTASVDESFTITVNEVNAAPTLAPIGNKNASEGTLLTFTAAGADTDLPAQALTYSLQGTVPSGASINGTSGVFSWTPTEAQGGNSYTFTVRVSDGTANTDEAITVNVAEVNVAPTLASIGSKSVDELATLTFTASGSDVDLPAQTLVYSLAAGADPVPAGAAINSSSGAFSWTPTEAQGAGTYRFKVRVSDGSLVAEEEIQVTVAEVNQAPVLGAIGNKSVNEGSALSFTAGATDGDLPANSLTFSLQGAVPSGASIDPSTGIFSWTPTEAQGPGSFTFTVRVSDGSLSDDEAITVQVAEVNAAPTLASIGNQSVNEEASLTFAASGSDTDLPAQSLTYSLQGTVPSGASINATSGAFSWTPTEAQGPGSYTFTVRVSDGVANADETITVTVAEVNRAPVWTTIGSKSVDEGSLLTFTVAATDADLPANVLSYSVVGALPSGATFNPSTRTFSWTPSEAQGPSAPTVTLRVSDGTASVDESFTITVAEVNQAPALAAIANQSVDEEVALALTAAGSDADDPANTLTYSLEGTVPSGASIDPATGAFSWTPTEAQGPGSYPITVRVTDNGSPVLFAERSFVVTVKEVNRAPTLAPIGNKSVDELALLSFTAAGSDADLPANTLAYSLVGAPAGASINATTGAFSWTPTEAQGPGSYTFTVRVSDGTANADEEITVSVAEVNVAPVLAAIGNKSTAWGNAVTFTASATDADLPANALTFSLQGAVPTGASIDPATGAFSWTPSMAQFLSATTYTFTVRVSDGTANDEEQITVTLGQRATTLVYSGDASAPYSDAAALRATLTDNGGGSLQGSPIAGKAVGFTIGTQSVTSAGTNASGLASASLTLTQNPAGSYTVQSAFAGDAAYSGSNDSDAFDVEQESAVTTYTGLMAVSTPSVSSNQATVTLRASIQEVADASLGDIRNAKISFVDRSGTSDVAIPNCSNLTVVLLNGDPNTGTASCDWVATIQNNQPGQQFNIAVVVSGYYTAATDEEVLINVSLPLSGFITGGGFLINERSGGSYGGTPGLKTTAGFNVKNNKSGTNLQGNVTIIVRRNGKTYMIKSNAISSMTATLANGPTPGTAQFSGKANLQDITNPLSPISLGGGYVLQMTLTDNGEPGSNDRIGFTLWDGNTLAFSSNWTGTATTEQQLGNGHGGGNVQVR